MVVVAVAAVLNKVNGASSVLQDLVVTDDLLVVVLVEVLPRVRPLPACPRAQSDLRRDLVVSLRCRLWLLVPTQGVLLTVAVREVPVARVVAVDSVVAVVKGVRDVGLPGLVLVVVDRAVAEVLLLPEFSPQSSRPSLLLRPPHSRRTPSPGACRSDHSVSSSNCGRQRPTTMNREESRITAKLPKQSRVQSHPPTEFAPLIL